MADWGGGMSAECSADPIYCLLVRAMDCCIKRRGIISSCQSAASSEIVKRFWSRVPRVSSATCIVRDCTLLYFRELHKIALAARAPFPPGPPTSLFLKKFVIMSYAGLPLYKISFRTP